jgi:hypothetical protein
MEPSPAFYCINSNSLANDKSLAGRYAGSNLIPLGNLPYTGQKPCHEKRFSFAFSDVCSLFLPVGAYSRNSLPPN